MVTSHSSGYDGLSQHIVATQKYYRLLRNSNTSYVLPQCSLDVVFFTLEIIILPL